MKIVSISCDVCGAKSNYDPNFKEGLEIDIIFETEQTEGRASKPYLSRCKIDLCCDCYGNILEGNYIFAQGAQGFNKYFFKRDEVNLKGLNER